MAGTALKRAATETRFVPVTEQEEVEALFAASREAPVLLFKHDPYCIVSLMALQELERLGGEIPTVNVAGSRTLSLGLAARTGVKHESPQVLVLRDGAAAWAASHGRITAGAVAEAMGED